MNKILVSGRFKAKADGDALFIEGWANKAVVDDVGDCMVFTDASVDFERFEKNPQMFFNHDRDYTVGRWNEWKVVPGEGLWDVVLLDRIRMGHAYLILEQVLREKG